MVLGWSVDAKRAGAAESIAVSALIKRNEWSITDPSPSQYPPCSGQHPSLSIQAEREFIDAEI